MPASDAGRNVWFWCGLWMAGWTAWGTTLALPRLFRGGRSGAGKNLLAFAVGLIHVFVIFAAWWGARVVIGRTDRLGFAYWAMVAIVMICVVTVFDKFVGRGASGDLSAVRVAKEFACLCLGVVLLSMIGNGSLPLHPGPSQQQPKRGAAAAK